MYVFYYVCILLCIYFLQERIFTSQFDPKLQV